MTPWTTTAGHIMLTANMTPWAKTAEVTSL